jgi:myo-inositol-1(or 4)-monophosphatase
VWQEALKLPLAAGAIRRAKNGTKIYSPAEILRESPAATGSGGGAYATTHHPSPPPRMWPQPVFDGRALRNKEYHVRELEFIEQFLAANLQYVRDKYASRGALTVTSKRDANDLLTEVDLTLQKRAVDQIRENFPGDAIVAEEGEFSRFGPELQGRCWVMDPIDGTNNFVRGLFPIFAVSLAFAMRGVPAAAGVLLPGPGDVFLAERGSGTFRNGQRQTVSDVKAAANARMDVDFATRDDRVELLRRASDLMAGIGQIRCHGSAVASITQVATGDVEAYIHMNLSPWDYAAAQLLVEEAGGKATRLNGAPLYLFDQKAGLLISNGAVHEELLGMLGE